MGEGQLAFASWMFWPRILIGLQWPALLARIRIFNFEV